MGSTSRARPSFRRLFRQRSAQVRPARRRPVRREPGLCQAPLCDSGRCARHRVRRCSKALQVSVDDQTYCRTRISDAKLQAADLRDASFWRTAMERADLSYEAGEGGAGPRRPEGRRPAIRRSPRRSPFGARLDDARLKQARLDGANLSCAWARNADLEAADLPMAVLLKARLEGANLGDAGLEGAYLAQARLSAGRACGQLLRGRGSARCRARGRPVRHLAKRAAVLWLGEPAGRRG